MDVECVQPFDGLVDPLPPGAAWTGGWPEPMFLMVRSGVFLFLSSVVWYSVFKSSFLPWWTRCHQARRGPAEMA